jgi:hypothetical protein
MTDPDLLTLASAGADPDEAIAKFAHRTRH